MTTAETDLTAWLLEQIDEDERIARDVPRGPEWGVADVKPVEWGDVTPDTELIGGGKLIARFSEEYGGYLNALHAERWDPARALAECVAKRKRIELHGADRDRIGTPCKSCFYDDLGVHGLDRAGYPCDTLKAEALPYVDRPGYREEWKP